MIFFCMRIKNGFHINGFALSLALKQRLEATRKWPNIAYWFSLSELDSESNISCEATYSEMRIKPAGGFLPLFWFFCCCFFVIQFLLDLFFVKLKLTLHRFFSLGRWLCNNRGRCYITAIPRCHLSSSLSSRQSDSKETSSKQNGITEKLKTYLN